MMKRPSRLSKVTKKSALKRKSISESRFPKSIKKSSRRRVYEDMDDIRVFDDDDDYDPAYNNFNKFLEDHPFEKNNPKENRRVIHRGIKVQYGKEAADYCIDAYDRFRKKFDVYNNEEAFNWAREGEVICNPEIKTYADFAKLYLVSEFKNMADFYDAIYDGIRHGGVRDKGEFIIDTRDLQDCIYIDYDAFGKKLEERFFDSNHSGEGEFILTPTNGLLLYPANRIFANGVENIYYLKNIKSFN